MLESLSPRDRKLLAFLVVFLSAVIVGAVLLTLRAWLNDSASRVATQKETLALLQDLGDEYAAAAAQVKAAESRAQEFSGQSLSAYLEKTANKVGVGDQLAVSKLGSEEVGGVPQTRWKVELSRIPLDLGLNFVYDIETSGYPLAVETARVKTTSSRGEVTYSFTLEIVTFELGGGA